MHVHNVSNRTFFQGMTLALIAGVFACGPAAAAKNDPPQTTTDGLTLTTQTKTRYVYTADGADLSQYSKVMIIECAVAFEKNWQRDYNRDVISLDRRVSDRDVARMKKDMAAEFKKIFTETMTKKGHEVVTEPAEDVLILRPAIINLVVSAPDTDTMSRSRTYVADPGQMTLYIELYDSVSSAKLAQIIDAADAGRLAPATMYANKVTNVAAADRVLRMWAETLAEHIGEVRAAAP